MGDLVVNVPMMLFWSFAALLFNPRDAKRLFGFIGAGGTFACILTGALIKPFTTYWGTENLLILVAGYLLIFLGSVWRLAKSQSPNLQPQNSTTSNNQSNTGKYYAQLISTPQVRSLILLISTATFALTIVDYQFKAGSQLNYPSDQLAGFFGNFYSVSSIVALLIQLFLVHRILQKGGVFLALSLLPIGLIIGTSGTLLSTQFGWIITTKFIVQTLLFTIEMAAVQMLYLGIPIQTRSQARTFVDGIAKPIAIALTGLALIGASQFIALHQLALGGLFASLCWLGFSRRNYKSYVAALIESLGARRFDFSQETSGINDKTLEAHIRQSLREASDNELIYLVGMVSDLNEVDWTPEFRTLIKRDLPEVKVEALNHLRQNGDESDLADILPLLTHEDHRVRAAAIPALATLGGQEIIPKLESKLKDNASEVRSAAIAALIDSGDLDYLLEAGIVLRNLLQSQHKTERLAAARAIEMIQSADLLKPVIGLLQDEDPDVRIAALQSAKAHINPRMIPVVITLLSDKEVASSTADLLPYFGTDTLDHLVPYLELREAEGAFKGAHHVPDIMAAIGDRRVLPVLQTAAQTKDLSLRRRIVKAYAKLITTAPSAKPYQDQLNQLIQSELNAAKQRKVQRHTFSELAGNELLTSALEEAKRSHVQNAFQLLDVSLPAVDLHNVLGSLTHTEGADRANALEILDNVLSQNIKPDVLALFDNQTILNSSPPTSDKLLELLIPNESRWIIAGALIVLVNNPSMTRAQSLTPLLHHKDAAVRETTLFALSKIGDAQILEEHSARLKRDSDKSVRTLALSLSK
jgi:AAA family ATP:ADP antiporter